MANVYIASRFKTLPKLLALADKLIASGHAITSEWIYKDAANPVPFRSPLYEQNCVEVQEKDIQDVLRSSALVLFTEECERTPGGLWFEAGLALGRGIPYYVLGPRINIFCFRPGVWMPDEDALFAALNRLDNVLPPESQY